MTVLAPQAQLAYQSVLQTKMQAAWRCFAQTANRYGGGVTTQALSWGPLLGTIGGPVSAVGRRGKVTVTNPVGGNAIAVQVAGGANYANGDIVTFDPINGGRPIAVRVLTNVGGAPTTLAIVDPGSGLVFGGDGKNNYNSVPPTPVALTQASTTGIGAGATWTANGGINFLVGEQPFPSV